MCISWINKRLYSIKIHGTTVTKNCDEVEWLKLAIAVTLQLYSAVHGFWPAEELAELADGPTGCGEVARGGCLFAWNLESDVVKCIRRRRNGTDRT